MSIKKILDTLPIGIWVLLSLICIFAAILFLCVVRAQNVTCRNGGYIRAIRFNGKDVCIGIGSDGEVVAERLLDVIERLEQGQ